MATKPLVRRSILVSKQSVRVARGHRRPLRCTPSCFYPASRRSLAIRSRPRSMPDSCPSDGGLVVLREIERRLGLADVITGPLRDDRDLLA